MKWNNNELNEAYTQIQKKFKNSIYSNAIQKRSVDLSEVAQNESFTMDFIQQILENKTSETEIEVRENAAPLLHHHYTQQCNDKSEQGGQHTAFAYPMFIDRKELSLQPIVAPLFIWNVEIHPSPNRTNNWIIKKTDNKFIAANPFVIQYLQEEYQLDIRDKIEAIVKKTNLSTKDISSFCQEIIQALDISTPFPEASTLLRVPTIDEELLFEQPEALIHPSGVLGQFGSTHFTLLSHAQKQLEKEEITTLKSNKKEKKGHPFSLVCPDPCQKSIVTQTQQQKITIGEGGTSSGKTYTVAHLVSNALANGKNCLVISPNNKGLEQIYNILNNHKLGGLSYLFQNDKDVAPFFQSLKHNAQKSIKINKEQDLAFQILLHRTIGRQERILNHHRLINQNTFGDLDFTETVGRYIYSGKKAGKNILSGRLSAKDYKFTFREYDILKTDILKGEKLFQKVQELNHPLEVLHDDLYLEQPLEESTAFLDKHLPAFKKKTEQLLQKFSVGLASYKDNLQEHYEEHAKELHLHLTHIKEKINEYGQVFGEDFKRSGNVKLQLYGVFSDSYFNIKEARKEINTEIEQLQQRFDEKRYFEYKFPHKKDLDTVEAKQLMLEDFEQTLKNWIPLISQNVELESQKLSSKSVQIHLDYQNKIGELEYQHDLLLEELNQTKLFNEWFSYDGITLTKRIESLERLLDLMEKTDKKRTEYNCFYAWRKHQLEILPISRNTTQSIIQSRAKNWLAAFDSWYFYNSLSEKTYLAESINDEFREKHVEDLARIKALLPEHIQQIWNEKKNTSLEQFKKQNKKRYQLLAQKRSKIPNEITLAELIQTLAPAIPSCFPVLMLTPDLAEKLLLSADISFDYIIIDDAQNIPTLQGIFLLEKAKKALLLGDRRKNISSHQTQDILSNLVEKGVDVNPLYYLHEPKETNSLAFLKHTSYIDDLKQIHYTKQEVKHSGISLIFTEHCRYLEEQQYNPLECENIITILTKIEKKEDGAFPKVAIITNTIAQRNYINSLLLYIKQKRSPHSEKIKQLENAGLRVLYNEEMQHPFDTVIWSMTFGNIDMKGNITQDFYTMESNFGQKTINTVLGNTSQKLIVCSSIPPRFWEQKIEENPSSCGITTQFLRYTQLITEQADESEIQSYLSSIAWHSLRENENPYSFMQQVKRELEPYFEPERIQFLSPLTEIGTSAITIAPLNSLQLTPLIIGDAIDRNSPVVATEFEQNIRRKLKESGYEIYPIRSLDWWKNPKREARKLASLLIKADNFFSEQDFSESSEQ